MHSREGLHQTRGSPVPAPGQTAGSPMPGQLRQRQDAKKSPNHGVQSPHLLCDLRQVTSHLSLGFFLQTPTTLQGCGEAPGRYSVYEKARHKWTADKHQVLWVVSCRSPAPDPAHGPGRVCAGACSQSHGPPRKLGECWGQRRSWEGM